MSNYRIYKRKDYYIIKKKGWFIWRPIKEIHVDVIGGYYEEPMKFDTLEKANEFVQYLAEENKQDILVAEYKS